MYEYKVMLYQKQLAFCSCGDHSETNMRFDHVVIIQKQTCALFMWCLFRNKLTEKLWPNLTACSLLDFNTSSACYILNTNVALL
jgi:hypothetical protein